MYPDESGVGFFQVITVAGAGVFVYSGAPGPGNLIVSVASTSGTDSQGNEYLSGVVVYSQLGATFIAARLVGGTLGTAGLFYYTAPGAGGPYTLIAENFADTTGQQFIEGSQVVIGAVGATAATSALLEVQGSADITSGGLTVTGGETVDKLAVSSSQSGGLVLSVTNTHTNPSAPSAQFTATTAADRTIGVQVSGDSFQRFQQNSNGDEQWGSGAGAVDITLKRQAANLLALLTSDLAIGTAGRGLQVKEGSNAKQGTATLVGGTVVVANTSVTANSRIFLTPQTLSGAARPQGLGVTAITAGTSFTVESGSSLDTSTFAYEIIEPA